MKQIINISHEKQIIIMAQSSMRLAVDLAISLNKQEDLKYIENTANSLIEMEVKLAQRNIKELKEVGTNSRKEDVKNLKAGVVDKASLTAFWNSLTEQEQTEKFNLNFYKSTLKKYAV